MGKRRILSIVAFALLLATSSIFAQGFQVGSLTGTVVDQNGGVLPGATVEIESEERGTSRTGVSNSEGDFRFSQLPIGTYTVRASLSGFQSAISTGNRVVSDKTTDVRMTLGLMASDIITVVGQAPVVDRTNSAVDTRMNQEEFQKLPIGRSYQSLLARAPGVIDTDGDANPTVNGATESANVYLFDGVDTTDTTTGTFGSNLNFEAIEEVNIYTAGASAEYGRATGAIMQVITKSGTNDFEGSLKAIAVNDSWDDQNKTKNPLTGDSFARNKVDEDNIRYTATLGGPLWRDRAWFFGAYETYESVLGPTQLPISHEEYTENRDLTLDNYRLTLQLNDSHNVWAKYDSDPYTGILRTYGAPAEIFALTAQDQGGERYAAQWTGIIGSNIAVEAMYGTSDSTITVRPHMLSPLTNGAVHYDLTTGRYYNGAYFDGYVDRPREQAIAAVSYFANLADNAHEIKVGVDWQSLESGSAFAPTAGQLYIDNSFDYVNRTFDPYLRRDYETGPSISKGEIIALYALDRFELGDRLFFDAGLRFEQQTGDSDLGNTTLDTSTIAPRLSGSYDLTGEGRTLIKGSAGRFYQSVIQDFSDNFAAVPQYANYDQYIWDPDAQEFVYLSTRDVSGNSLSPNLNLDPSYVDELTLGVQQQLTNTLGVGVRGIWRKFKDLIDDLYGVDANGNYFQDFVNLSSAKREYKALQLTAEKRFSNHWSALANYTYSQTEGNHFGTYATSLDDFSGSQCEVQDATVGVIPCTQVTGSKALYGGPSNDIPHSVNALATYAFNLGIVDLTIGGGAYWQSGVSFSKTAVAEVLDQNGDGTGDTYNYYYGNRGSDRLGSWYRLDTSFEATFPLMEVLDIGLKAEVFNLTNVQDQIGVTSTRYCYDDSAQCVSDRNSFGLGTTRGAYQAPRNYRVSAIVRF